MILHVFYLFFSLVPRLMSDDVFIMASVRHPVQHFLSLYKYSGIQKAVERLQNKKLNTWESMRIFFKKPSAVQNAYATYTDGEVRDKLQVIMVRPNLQLFSLGVTSADLNEIEKVTSDIDFLVVAEIFNESMVILREKLCCSIEDVVYRRQNVGRSNSETEKVPHDIKKAILKFNSGDLLLYALSQRRLYNEIVKISNFELFMNIYKHELEKYQKKCSDAPVQDYLCPPISNGEIGAFVEHVRSRQRDKLLQKLRKEYVDRKVISGRGRVGLGL